MKFTRTITILTVVLAFVATASADWNPGDPHKMHFPQLPDPQGWDVASYTHGGPIDGTGFVVPMPIGLADDWRCSGTAPVEDIHFWASWKGGAYADIGTISVKIYSDDPAGEGGTNPNNPFSKPDETLWEREFTQDQFTTRFYGNGDQGWFDPAYPPATGRPDHSEFYQVNITKIQDPYVQQNGTIYWLGLGIDSPGPTNVGWKTADVSRYPSGFAGEHFMDDAVYTGLSLIGQPTTWLELIDPDTGHSLDLAFVITPEPATMSLLALGGLALIHRGRRRRTKGQTC